MNSKQKNLIIAAASLVLIIIFMIVSISMASCRNTEKDSGKSAEPITVIAATENT